MWGDHFWAGCSVCGISLAGRSMREVTQLIFLHERKFHNKDEVDVANSLIQLCEGLGDKVAQA